MFFTTLIASVLSSSLLAAATDVAVSLPGGLSYNPTTVTAKAGDNVIFTFSSTHTVTQSTFDTPCSPKSGGFDSGNKASGTYTVTVNDTNPVWVYCAIAGHCQGGMVFAINPMTSGDETFQNFQAKAEGKSITTSGSGGGSSTSRPTGSSTSGSSSSPTPSKGGSTNPYPGVATSIFAAGSAFFLTAGLIGYTSIKYLMST